MSEALWPALSFGPVNLWRVQPAWRMSPDLRFTHPRAAPPVRPLAGIRINPRVALLLRHRKEHSL